MTSPMPAYRRPEPPSTRMHKISLAPVLSATLSRDSCWITSTPAPSRRPPGGPGGSWCSLLGLLENPRDAPALGRGQRPGLHQQDPVAHAARVLGVVRLVPLGTADDLAVLRVLDPVLDLDDHGLVHLVADHQALTGLSVATRRRRRHHFLCRVTHRHPPLPPPSRCRAPVPASPCRCGQSPCGRRAAARGSPAGRWPPGTGG